MAPDNLTLYHTMTSPNTNFNLLNNAANLEIKPMAVGCKSVYVGKDKYLLSILGLSPITGKAWKKCFF